MRPAPATNASPFGMSAFTAAGHVRFGRDAAAARIFVEGNADSDLAAEFRIEMLGPYTLVAGDVVL